MSDELKKVEDEEKKAEVEEEVEVEQTVTVEEMKRRLDRLEEKHKGQLAEALEKERTYSQMSEKEKQDAQLVEREQELHEREQAIARMELQAEVRSDVQGKGLPVELVEILTTTSDKEQILETVNAIKKLVDESITEGVKATARQSPPGEPTREYGTERGTTGIREFASKNRLIK